MHERKLQLLFHIRDHVYIQETMLLNAKQNGENLNGFILSCKSNFQYTWIRKKENLRT